MIGRNAARTALAALLVAAASSAHAEIIVLACKRVDLKPGLRANELRFKLDLSAGTVTNLYSLNETVPATIGPKSVDWVDGSIPGRHHIDRDTGHFSTVLPASHGGGTVEMACEKVPSQGF